MRVIPLEVSRLRFARGFAVVERAGVWVFITVLGGARSRVRLALRIGVKKERGVGLISG
jgi:hypothetical protein